LRYLLFLIVALFNTNVAAADDEVLAEALIYREDFDGPQALMGAVRISADATWTVDFEEGQLNFANTRHNGAVRYFDVPTASFPFGDEFTDGLDFGAAMKVETTQDGGIGLLVGYPNGGDYAVFAIGRGQTYAILHKREGKTRRIADGTAPAIKADGFNDLFVQRQAGKLSFRVNGSEVYAMAEPTLVGAPVGMAAFGQGRFSVDSLEIMPPTGRVSEFRDTSSACGLPRPAGGDRLVLLHAAAGASMSSVAIGDPANVTSVIDIQSERAPQRTYVIAMSLSPLIWRITGANERIAHVAVLSQQPGSAGVAGLPPARVSFHSGDDCPDLFRGSNRDVERTVAGLVAELDRRPDMVASAREPGAFVLPDAAVIEGPQLVAGLKPGWRTASILELLRYYPGGVTGLDAAGVVSAGRVVAYPVLPNQAGIADFVADGTLVPIGKGSQFRVVKPMPGYPPGLTGAHRVFFSFAYDVPIPVGSPGHSEVVREPPSTAE
jgi:hypothetical protein